MSGLVFVGGGTGSTFFAVAFMTGALAAGLTDTVFASEDFGFFTTLVAGKTLFVEASDDFVSFGGAAVFGFGPFFEGTTLVFSVFCARTLDGFFSDFAFAVALVGTAFVAIALTAFDAFSFGLFVASAFFGATAVRTLVGFGLAAGLEALVPGFSVEPAAFLLGLAVDNFTAAFGVAVFLRAVGKVKLLANLASKAT